ncbi:hypothetical protein AAIB41_06440 [Brucella sp. BE17]|uniref:hypothetical protein n=1 Tax=Brucella sp. BE17 TaxID=3142977 RepID=UPI0031BAA824
MRTSRYVTIILLAGFLTGCNSTESALNVQNSQQTAKNTAENTDQTSDQTSGQNIGENTASSSVQPSAQTVGTATTTATPARTATLKPGNLHIAPIVGAPVSVVTPLTHRMSDDARAKGIKLAGSNDPSAAYVMKGYFSALSEDNQTTVLYVWDVLDASGNRLHRIQGQEKVQGASEDSWSVVQPAAMQAIADRTMQEYSSWLAANRA